jgi:UDP-N-acetylglucosamine--N-acetylmuramyl-(pentapeptide) pyrophosphoryl-undecaprenol N-acetylglucosamine transferase
VLSAQKLAALLSELLADRVRLQRMAEAARGVAWTDASERIAQATLAAGGATW